MLHVRLLPVKTSHHHHHQRSPRLLVRRAAAAVTPSPRCQIDVLAEDGVTLLSSLSCESGDQLRGVLLSNKVDLYTTWGKVGDACMVIALLS